MILMLPKVEFKVLAKKDPMIGEVYSKLQVMSADEANRMIYEARLKAQRKLTLFLTGKVLLHRGLTTYPTYSAMSFSHKKAARFDPGHFSFALYFFLIALFYGIIAE
ncbi:MAG: hypothetical protein LBK02_02675 [Treponema sp.]|jgi:hypothetical protein|nr:hypothetical protein [Treponema sp.]